MLHIGIDVMGGDYAPTAVLEGSLSALSVLKPDNQLVLVGPEDQIREFFKDQPSGKYQIVHAPEAVLMGEHPVKALQQKPYATLNVGIKLLLENKIQGFCSAGNSGAVMVAALNGLKTIKGVSRPCVVSAYPQPDGSHNVLVDVGINVDAKPELLLQFAKLGKVFSKQVYGVENPIIALLNTGNEEGKGSLLYQKAFELLKTDKELNFAGNLEARDFFEARVDVTVCDGFTGNVFLKQTEGFYKLLKQRNIQDPYLDKLNYENYGGTPVLGVNGNLILGHGVSGPVAIKNMILATERVAEARLSEHIKQYFSK